MKAQIKVSTNTLRMPKGLTKFARDWNQEAGEPAGGRAGILFVLLPPAPASCFFLLLLLSSSALVV
jgi:hypothetical protein